MRIIFIILILKLFVTTCSGQSGLLMNRYYISGSLSLGKTDRSFADSSAWLELGKDTTAKGIIFPRVLLDSITTTKRAMFVYDLKDSVLYHFDGANKVRYMTYKDTNLVKTLIQELAPPYTAGSGLILNDQEIRLDTNNWHSKNYYDGIFAHKAGDETIAGIKTFSSSPRVAGLTTGSILFSGSNSEISQSNSNLYWDNTNKFLGIGAVPATTLHIASSAPVLTFKSTNNASGLRMNVQAPAGFAYRFQYDGINLLTLLADGRIGFGTEGPAATYHFNNGNMRVSNTDGAETLLLESSLYPANFIRLYNGGTIQVGRVAGSTQGMTLSTISTGAWGTGGGYIRLAPNGTEVLKATTGGTVEITGTLNGTGRIYTSGEGFGAEYTKYIGWRNGAQGWRAVFQCNGGSTVYKDLFYPANPASKGGAVTGIIMAHGSDGNTYIQNVSYLDALTQVKIGKDNDGGVAPANGILVSGENTGGATNMPGSNLLIRAGCGTGNNTSYGNIVYQTPDAVTTGTSVQPYTTKATLYKNGSFVVGSNPPEVSAAFEVQSAAKGVILCKMTTAERDTIITPAEGLEIYNTTIHKKQVFDGTAWQDCW